MACWAFPRATMPARGSAGNLWHRTNPCFSPRARYYAVRWCELADRLDAKALLQLERKSLLWPVAAHNAFRRSLLRARERLLMPAAAQKTSQVFY